LTESDPGIDPHTAAALGWPKLKYACLEYERRWLAGEVPPELVIDASTITDLYLAGTRLRLREQTPLDGGVIVRRLTRKADVESGKRLITTIYLAPEEFAVLAALPGRRLAKVREHLAPCGSASSLCVDRFEGPLAGLALIEAEFADDEAMSAFAPPAFALAEVTSNPRYGGAALAEHGLPG
jgi:hypothetical protein